MARLELQNLNKTYSPKIVPVKELSLSVDDGEFLTLLGPSGCGKSTILRLIAGLEQPTRGQVLIGKRDVTRLGPGDRNIAMVFQSYALYPHMTVSDNIASGLKLRKTSATEIRQRVDEVSQVLGLEELLERKPGQLSGGQRQRVALGRALVRHPDVFLLDEPLSNLDALLRERVRAELKQLFKEQNAPVAYVTHDQTEAMTLSTKVAVLSNGNLQQLDPPDRIYTHPANQFVAGFIGSPQMNLLTLTCQNGHALLGDTRVPLPESLAAAQQIVLGIRPEHVHLQDAPTTPTATAHLSAHTSTLRGHLYLVENLGMHKLISVQVGNQQADPVPIRALLPADQTWSGEGVTLSLPSELIHWFDVATGDCVARRS